MQLLLYYFQIKNCLEIIAKLFSKMLCFRSNIMVFHSAALLPLNEFGFSDALDYGWTQTLFQIDNKKLVIDNKKW